MIHGKIIPYNPRLKEFSRKLRKEGTLAEKLLWRRLRGKQIRGYQFLRQKPLDNYIVDFFCKELLLAIEIDGRSHEYKVSQDKTRQKKLESYGINFLRFTEHDVRTNIEWVLRVIDDFIHEMEIRDE